MQENFYMLYYFLEEKSSMRVLEHIYLNHKKEYEWIYKWFRNVTEKQC